MRTTTKIMLSVVVVLLLAFVGVIAYRLIGGVGLGQLSSNPAGALTAALSPTRTLEDALRERTKTCSPQTQAAFVKEARRINDSFEDSYYLAMSAARIALTPVVRDMQQLARDMAALETDVCAKAVQDELLEAYGEVTDEVLTFMQDSDAYVSTFLLEYGLREATQHLELYALSPQALLYQLDIAERSDALREGEPVAPQLAYLKEFMTLDAHSQCVQSAQMWDYNMQALQAASRLFRLEPLDDSAAKPTDEAKVDKEPCADVPVVADPKSVTVEYQLTASTAKSTSAESVWIALPEGDEFYAVSVELPYTRTVQLMTGHRAQITGMAADYKRPISCAILADGKSVAEDKDQDTYASCTVVLE